MQSPTFTLNIPGVRSPQLINEPVQLLLQVQPSPALDTRAERVIGYLENNFQRQLSLAQMGRIIGLSPSRLRHLFKAETGTTPTQFLKRLRIRKAKSLLETTRLSVKEVMASVGVSDPSNFTRDFKRAHGLTPTQARNCQRLAVI